MTSDNDLLLTGMLLLIAGTYLLRIAGPLLSRYYRFSEELKQLLAEMVAVLLFAVAVSATFFEADHYAGHARVLGVCLAAFCAYKKLPFLVTVMSAALGTALVRLLGVA
ncbi:MAG: hypothetical protein OFPI_08410 [Osedax symbiont Rs2]|nr:MAG: hypothetical protein OFPI_08410 [Osedax symbiont Rs2]